MTPHKPDDVALIMDVTGTCQHCHHHTSARLVAYYDKSILVRCNHCKTANHFKIDDESWTDATRFAPFLNDEDDEKGDWNEPDRTGQGRT